MNCFFKSYAIKPSYILKEDEYRNAEGIICCNKCHSPRQVTILTGGTHLTVYALCNCGRDERDRKYAEQKAKMQREEIERNRSIGLTDPTMSQHTFDNDLGYNPRAMKIARNYVEHWDKYKKDGRGLLFWGDVGTGKSFIADCIGNELLNRGVRVLITNFSRLLNHLSDLHMGDKNGFIQDLNSYDLLILDDLGIERNSDYAREQVYNIIDSRYRSGLPMIVTTNLTLEVMRDSTDLGRYRICDRVLGKNVPVCVNDQNIRSILAKQATKQCKELLAPT